MKNFCENLVKKKSYEIVKIKFAMKGNTFVLLIIFYLHAK